MPDEKKTIAIPNVVAKLARLKQKAQSRHDHSGVFNKDASIASALGIAPGRFSQLFGKHADAEGGIVIATVERLIAALEAESVIVTVELLTAPMEIFEIHFPDESPARPTATIPTTSAEPPYASPDFLPPESAYFTGTDADPPDPVAELVAHAPCVDNEHGPDTYRLPISLAFATAERMPEGSNRAIRIGVNAALLSVDLRGYHFAPNTALGTKGNPYLPPEGDTTRVETLRLTAIAFQAGPDRKFLEGRLLEGHKLGTITPEAGHAEPTMRLTLTTAPRNLDFALLDDNGDPLPSDPTNDALAALIYAKSTGVKRNPATGRLTLATATLRRKT